jgi:hypothetical protein
MMSTKKELKKLSKVELIAMIDERDQVIDDLTEYQKESELLSNTIVYSENNQWGAFFGILSDLLYTKNKLNKDTNIDPAISEDDVNEALREYQEEYEPNEIAGVNELIEPLAGLFDVTDSLRGESPELDSVLDDLREALIATNLADRINSLRNDPEFNT